MTGKKGELLFRMMVRADIAQVLRIERTSFSSPWSKESFEAELKKAIGFSTVAVIRKKIVGYVMGWHIGDEIHIANIAVHPEWRRQGIGEKLIQKALTNQDGVACARLEVRRSNRAALALYQKLGFVQVGIRKNYYAQEGEDAVLMEKRFP